MDTRTDLGLHPPVPTELVSVFDLKTGSVQQEQEWSPLTWTFNYCFLTEKGAKHPIPDAVLAPSHRYRDASNKSLAEITLEQKPVRQRRSTLRPCKVVHVEYEESFFVENESFMSFFRV